MEHCYRYTNELKGNARQLRRAQTDAERFLWSRLRNRNINGYKFYRQFPIDRFILDFYCVEKNIAIELDGGQHLDEQRERDMERTEALRRRGIMVLRFWNTDVLQNIEGVFLHVIDALSGDVAETSPLPSPHRRGDERRPL